ncbi:unnamed protein product [Rotaria sp. Silwood1]|nr:unnamed protein product [Rotaria sp. Silwood1]
MTDDISLSLTDRILTTNNGNEIERLSWCNKFCGWCRWFGFRLARKKKQNADDKNKHNEAEPLIGYFQLVCISKLEWYTEQCHVVQQNPSGIISNNSEYQLNINITDFGPEDQ